MKKIAVITISTLVLLLVAGWVFIKVSPKTLVPYVIRDQLKVLGVETQAYYEEDAIVVVTVGTASPLPGTRAQTGTAVFVNNYFFMFDVGAGVVQKSEFFRLPLRELDGVFLTPLSLRSHYGPAQHHQPVLGDGPEARFVCLWPG